MIRYFDQGSRELVLLQGYPCIHKKCAFCTLHFDNSVDTKAMLKTNREAISQITGRHGILEVYNSGSIFELPSTTLLELREKIREKPVVKLITEAHWIYRENFEEMIWFFEAAEEVIIKVGVETFDNGIREKLMKKGMGRISPEEIRFYTSGINLLVGFKGQTQDTVKKDMEIALRLFDYVDINILDEKYTPDPGVIDQKLISWFLENYSYLEERTGFRIFRKVDDSGIGNI